MNWNKNNTAVFGPALVRVLLSVVVILQGLMFVQLVQCGGMDGHMMSGDHSFEMGHGAGHDHDGATNSVHLCPLGGCYECDPNECGQCSTAKIVAVFGDGPPPIGELAHGDRVKLAAYELKMKTALWSRPQGRAPPTNI